MSAARIKSGIVKLDEITKTGFGTIERMATSSTALISTEDGSLERLAGNLADQTRLPRELIQRFGEMWHNGERPFFSRVDAESGLLPFDALEELVRSLKI